MTRLVLALMVGALLVSSPAISQPMIYIGKIEKDRDNNSVKDLLKQIGCDKDWADLALWSEKKTGKPKWFGRIFSGKPRPPLGARVYLYVPSYEDCRISPKEYVKTGTFDEAPAETVLRRVEISPSPRVHSAPLPSPRRTPSRREVRSSRGKPEEKPASHNGSGNSSPLPVPTAAPSDSCIVWGAIGLVFVIFGAAIWWLWPKTKKVKVEEPQVTSSRDPQVDSREN